MRLMPKQLLLPSGLGASSPGAQDGQAASLPKSNPMNSKLPSTFSSHELLVHQFLGQHRRQDLGLQHCPLREMRSQG